MAAISFNRSPGDSALAVLAQKLVFACLIVGIMESETEELKALNINMKHQALHVTQTTAEKEETLFSGRGLITERL